MNLFTETEVMKNIVYEVQHLIHTVLQPQHADILHLFKMRLQRRYWQSGHDELLGPIDQDFAAAMDNLMLLSHQAAAENHTITSELVGPDRFFAISSLFSGTAKKVGDGQSASSQATPKVTPNQRLLVMSFLSKLFDFVTVLGDSQLVNRSGPKMRDIVSDMQKLGKFTASQVEEFKQKIGCAHMSFKMTKLAK